MSDVDDFNELWDKLALIQKAVDAQAEDETLWCTDVTIGEAYVQQSLRWLHMVIEDQDLGALKSIIEQREDRI